MLRRRAAIRLSPWRRWGLRARLVLTFAVGGVAIAGTIAMATYGLSRGFLLRQRETASLRQATVNAAFLQTSLRAGEADISSLLESLETSADSDSLLHRDGRWFTTSLGIGPDVVPPQLRDRALAGEAARQRFSDGGPPRLAIALPMPAVGPGTVYFEIFPLVELATTLGTLATILAITSAVSGVGAALIGLWGSRRVLRPLDDVSAAATAIAGGNLDRLHLDVGGRELSALARSFNAMVDALQLRMQRDARFASDISHELRSPLTALRTALEVVEGGRAELSERAQQALDVLTSEVQRFQRLVSDLLEISRIDAGVADLVLEEVQVAELVRRAVKDSAAHVTVAEEAEDMTAAIDKRRLERVLANLVDNAQVHGEPPITVAVSASDGGVEIAVEDAGRGVRSDDRQRVFERFARGSSAGRRGAGPGTGLGLALVAEHVRLHGGSVRVEDGSVGGARFVVWLPSPT